MAERLTDKLVRGLPAPEAGNRITYDDEVKGFGVRVTQAGGRSFVLTYRSDGVQRRLTIGDFGTWTTTAARAEAKALKRQIDRGTDPLQEKEQARRAMERERCEPTVEMLVEVYKAGQPDPDRPGEFIIAPRLPELRKNSQVAYRRYLDSVIVPRLGKMKLRDLTHQDVEGLHRAMKATPVAANRCVAVMKALLRFAVDNRLLTVSPSHGQRIERNPEEQRRRYLSEAEIARVGEVLDTLPSQSTANAFRLLLLTGARKNEVQAMRWSDLDLEAGTWTKPAATVKTKRMHQVPLAAPALQILVGMREKAAPGAAWVFPSPTDASAHIVHLSHAWGTVARKAGLVDAHLHDLRHSFASILASSGASLALIGSLLGHSQHQTTLRYAHLFDSAQRAAAEKVGQFVTAAVTKSTTDAEVVPLRPGRAK